MTGRSDLAERFRSALARQAMGDRVVVAVSGGLDSCALLHLARFAARDSGHEWVAAHFDHRMRSSSGADARWVAGLCKAWDVPLYTGRADEPLTSEDSARVARYDFFSEIRARTGSSVVLTGHHADDQAETVLFRLFRGAGSLGLSGIPAHRPGVVRPLLDFWRAELVEYARVSRLSWRDDPTNRDLGYARNALRNTILPEVERLVAPGARQALVRLADRAGDEEAAWESVLPRLMAPLGVREIEGGVSVERKALLELHPSVRARVIRALAMGLGNTLDHAATQRAMGFSVRGTSGRAIQLGGSLSLAIELDRCVLGRVREAREDQVLKIEDGGPGHGWVVLSGSSIPVTWGGDEVGRRRECESFGMSALRFPLTVRSRRPGDRIRLSGGTSKVKKVLLEDRIPPSERHRVPLVVDAEGEVLWIPGVARAVPRADDATSPGLRIGIG